MEYQDILLTIAEIAIALIGFSGIVVTLGKRREFTNADIRNLIVMLRAGFSAMFLAFLPLLLNLFVATNILWQLSIAVLSLVMFTNLFTYWRRSRTAGQSKIQMMMLPPGIIIASASFLAAIGVISPASSVYLIALVWMLFVGSHNFVLLLIDSVSLK